MNQVHLKEELVLHILLLGLNLKIYIVCNFIATAVVFNVPEKLTISSCAANDANINDGLKGIWLLYYFNNFFIKIFHIKPVPTAVPLAK